MEENSSMMQEAVIITEQWQFPRILGKSFFLPTENSETMKYYLYTTGIVKNLFLNTYNMVS